jgi:hypothetical protein
MILAALPDMTFPLFETETSDITVIRREEGFSLQSKQGKMRRLGSKKGPEAGKNKLFMYHQL